MKLDKNYKRKLQIKILDIVKDIDTLCIGNNIEHYILYGSALGVIRHKGFIHWDNNFDIGMTYDNYKKNLSICEKKLDKNKYYVQIYEKEKNYYLSFAKIRNITTTLTEEGNNDIDIIRSVYEYVFPLAGVPNNKFKQNILKINRAFMLSANNNIISNKLLSAIFKIILRIFDREKLLNYTTKRCFKYKTNETDYLVSITDGECYTQTKLKKEVFGKPKYVLFEDTILLAPEYAGAYLKSVYADYMKIPSEEQIKAREHTSYFPDFNLQSNEYKKGQGD